MDNFIYICSAIILGIALFFAIVATIANIISKHILKKRIKNERN